MKQFIYDMYWKTQALYWKRQADLYRKWEYEARVREAGKK